MSPVLGFAIYVAEAKRKGEVLNTARAFTALSLFTLVSAPLNIFIQTLPSIISAKACAQRIQTFLSNAPRKDYRTFSKHPSPGVEYSRSMVKNDPNSVKEREEVISANSTPLVTEISIRSGTFRWKAQDQPVLKNIDFNAQSSDLTIIIGPVSSGKTSFLCALLGEMPVVDGSVFVSNPEIAFCAQAPWLRNTTVQQNILGESLFDRDWYKEVIHVCVLDETLKTLPNGDRTVVGSKGLTLSGGEKLRIVCTPEFNIINLRG